MTKLETAKSMAQAHKDFEPNLTNVYLVEPIAESDPEEPVKLLEVVDGTIERGIEPLTFAADPAHGREYVSVIIEVSPREFEAVLSGKLTFPRPSWKLGQELALQVAA